MQHLLYSTGESLESRKGICDCFNNYLRPLMLFFVVLWFIDCWLDRKGKKQIYFFLWVMNVFSTSLLFS